MPHKKQADHNHRVISRGPVREAILRIDQEGEVFVPTRRVIETFVAKNACRYLTIADYQYLESLIQQMEMADAEDDLYNLTDLDMKFHSYLIEHTLLVLQSVLYGIIYHPKPVHTYCNKES